MILSILIFLLLSVLPVLQAEASERPSLYSYAPAYPVGLPKLSQPEGRMPYITREKIVRVNVHLDEKGIVGDVIAVDTANQKFADYAMQWIDVISFEPAEFNGKVTASFLPLDLRYRPKVRYPEILFPVNNDLTISNRDLYYSSVKAQGYTLPKLKKFGKYFCTLEWTDTLGLYPYVLVEVSLDSTGYPVDVKHVSDQYPELVQQVMSGALWAEYEPLKSQSGAKATTCFLLVSFFPQLHYPVAVWEDVDSLPTADLRRARVQLLPDTVGLMQLPVCKTASAGEFTIPGDNRMLIDTITAVLSVDSSGSVSLFRISRTHAPDKNAVRSLERKFKFYPARDFSGNPHYFSGLIEIVFDASEIVRINYSW